MESMVDGERTKEAIADDVFALVSPRLGLA